MALRLVQGNRGHQVQCSECGTLEYRDRKVRADAKILLCHGCEKRGIRAMLNQTKYDAKQRARTGN